MAACYAPNATFSDPVFQHLEGAEVPAMWRMLCERGTDLEIVHSAVETDGERGSAHWDADYTRIIRQGVDTFRTYVTAWYDGTLEKIFFAREQDPEIRKQICSVLAGYVWDQTNPYVSDHERSIERLARLVDAHERLKFR